MNIQSTSSGQINSLKKVYDPLGVQGMLGQGGGEPQLRFQEMMAAQAATLTLEGVGAKGEKPGAVEGKGGEEGAALSPDAFKERMDSLMAEMARHLGGGLGNMNPETMLSRFIDPSSGGGGGGQGGFNPAEFLGGSNSSSAAEYEQEEILAMMENQRARMAADMKHDPDRPNYENTQNNARDKAIKAYQQMQNNPFMQTAKQQLASELNIGG